jgi:hypothetical protein
MGVEEAARVLEPVAQVDPASDDIRVVAAEVVDLVELDEVGWAAVVLEYVSNRLRDLEVAAKCRNRKPASAQFVQSRSEAP